MSTVPDRWDHAISWVPDGPAPHNRSPVFLSTYVDALEALVRSGDSGPDDLARLRARMGLKADTAPRPVTLAAMPGGNGFNSHYWVGRESLATAHCSKCGASSNSIQSMKECEPA